MQDAFGAKSPFLMVIDGLLHETGKKTKAEQARHRVFVGLHLLVAGLALASLPMLILFTSSLNGQLINALTLLPIWMMAPLLSVAYLSRTGKLGNAFLVTAALTAAFLVWIASMTGGIASPHLIWLAILPLEVALAGNSKFIKATLVICLAAVATVIGLEQVQLIASLQMSDLVQSIIGSLSICLAILYAGMLAIRVERMNHHRLSDLKAKEVHYRSLANSLSDMITGHDRSGDVTFASDACRSLLAVDPSEMFGNRMFHQVHIPDRPAYLRALSDCMNLPEDEDEAVSVEMRVMVQQAESDAETGLPQQQLRWVEMKCMPKRDTSGTIVGAIAATRDISKRKESQFALEEAKAEAERASESKIRFLANVTHELRTPLNTIIGFSEILCHPEFSKDSIERNREYAELIHKGGHHLLQLVNGLLDMSRLESGNFEVNPQAFDINDLVLSCSKMMQTEADRRGIALYSQCSETLPDAYLDPRACRQIVLNLVSNALKFSDKGDQVCVSVNWVGKANDKGQVIIKVSDTGIGIDKQDLPNLAQPFVQAESSLQRRFEGAGIGLSITRGLTELQQGTFEIDSVLGKGTTVTIRLPMAMVEEEAPSAPLPSKSVAMIGGEQSGEEQGKSINTNPSVSFSGKKIA